TGIMLNNRAGRGFTLQEGHPNCIAPGKRTMHTLMPFLATRNGSPWLAWGTPGGDGQPQWDLQAFSAIVDSRFGAQEAVELPRWMSFPSTDPANLPAPFELRAEPGFPEAALMELAGMGHEIRRLGSWQTSGGMQAIMIEGDVYTGASDPRVDGCAVGY
ncbi:MAG TPA: gamma-glutamyltransferase, partial [bacterium]|nr:gamma-glutamyltransferase [bacterium]